MIFPLVIAYFLVFFALAWKNFRLAVILFIIALPTYLIRFTVGPLPSTALELAFGALFLVWLIKYSRQDFWLILATIKKHKVWFAAFGLFFISSVVSVAISDLLLLSLGQWRAYFLEPMIFFLILVGRKEEIKTADLIWGLVISTLSISVYGVIQKFTGWGIATPEWTNAATRRVTAFFSSPNAVGLYLAPILPLIALFIIGKKQKLKKSAVWILAVTGAFSLLAIVFTKSQGTWIGIGAGVLVFLFFVGYRKLAMAAAILGIIFSLAVPSMRQAVLFKDQANQNRLRLWGYTEIFLGKSAKNFMLGTGMGEFFRKVQKPYYNVKIMERLIYPHNIFLNFWTEVGLLGMLAMVVMLSYVGSLANQIRKKDKLVGASLLAMLTVLVVHGLVDVPYFKNDLSFLFWILMMVVFVSYEDIYQS